MPHFTVIIKVPNGQPIEGVVSADTVDQAISTGRRMGHNIDEEATRKLAAADTGSPGKTAAQVSVLVTLAGGWYAVSIGLTAIILAVIAIEVSQRRRGIGALVLAMIVTAGSVGIKLLRAHHTGGY